MRIKDIVETYIRVWKGTILNGEIAPWEAMFDHGFILHNRGMDIGLESYRQHEIDLRNYTKWISVDIKYVTSDRYLFALDFKGHFICTSDIPGRPGTAGKEVKSDVLCLFRTKNGKVVEEWSNGTMTGLT